MEKLTHEEHTARAMLLGMVYDWRDSTYNYVYRDVMSPHGMLDAKTMEPIDPIRAADRQVARDLGNVWPGQAPTRDADYDD